MHKLFVSPNSPYARKCRIMVIEKKLEAQVEQIIVNPLENPPQLITANPLGKIPALVTDSGMHLCDSPLICEYLDGISAPALIPTSGNRRWEILGLAALCDGIMDMAVECVLQSRRPEEKRWPDWISRREGQILRTVEQISSSSLIKEETLHFGHVTVAVALAYLDFRLPHLDWRKALPSLADWLDAFAIRPSMQTTVPSG